MSDATHSGDAVVIGGAAQRVAAVLAGVHALACCSLPHRTDTACCAAFARTAGKGSASNEAHGDGSCLLTVLVACKRPLNR